MLSIKDYIIASLAAAIVGLGLYGSGVVGTLESRITVLENKVSVKTSELSACNGNVVSAKGIIAEQSKAINDISVEYNTSIAAYNELASKPDKIRYKVIYKTIREEVDYSKGECNDTKELINSIRLIDYNGL